MLSIHPKVAICMLSASDNMRDFFSSVVNGISSAQFEFLYIEMLIFPERVVVKVIFFVVNRLNIDEIRFRVFSFRKMETLAHTGFNESAMFVGMTTFAGVYS